MTDIIAVLGFFTFWIAVIMRKPLMAYIEQSKVAHKDVTALSERVQQLEGSIVTMGKDIQEVKDTSEFAHKLLIDSAQQIADAHKLLTNNAQQMADAHKFVISVQQDIAKGAVTIAPPKPATEPKLLTASTCLINDLGKVSGDGTIRFERTLPAPIERVWQHLTASDCLPQWLAEGSIEQRFGGKVELNFDINEMPERKDKGARLVWGVHGHVTFIEPLRTLAYSWIDPDSNLESHVSFQVTAQGDQTALVLTHSQVPADRLHEMLAGWHTHLDILKARLSGGVPPTFSKRFKEVLQTYVAVVATTVFISAAAAATPAVAGTTNEAYQVIQAEKSHILSKYDALAREADDLKKQIADLKRDTSNEAARAADHLGKQLDNDNRDLSAMDIELKDLDRALN
jgi:uncharacterized protein YndB with AHSA1/START domain/predicted  nucleic acid-binding Zn-ribbon protein